MTVPIDQLPLDETDRDTAVLAARRPSAGSLVVVEGTAASLLATSLAHAWTEADDVAVVAPATGRWAAAEVRDVLAAAVSRTPQVRHAVVVTAAQTFTPALYDRTLKLFEEPPAPAWFLLCVDDAGQVPPAVRGRSGLVLQARPAPPAQRAEQLVSAGLDRADADRAVAACGGWVELELAVAADPALLGPLEQLHEVRALGPSPLTRAHEAMAVVDTLAGGLDGVVGTRAAAQRTVVALLLDRWAAQAAGLLRDEAVADATAVGLAGAFLQAVDTAREALDRNVGAAAVMATVMASG